MTFTLWLLVVGLLLVGMALCASFLRRLPVSAFMLYVGIGVALGPVGVGAIRLDPVEQSAVLERVAEIAVIVSLFTAGLKLRGSLREPRWRLPLRLAFGSMATSVALVTAAGVLGLGLPLGAAVLLGAILAPTDPVLASDVQVRDPTDHDRLRFTLTGEAGLNDGTAFPFIMLGLGLLGLHDLRELGWRWVAVDVVWAGAGGLAIGALLGTMVGRLVLYLRREHKEAVGLDEFLALGLIATSYAGALLAGTYGFLSVFAAGLALRSVEAQHTPGEEPPAELPALAEAGRREEIATDPEKAPAYMAQAVLAFNEQLERIGEMAVVVLVGGMLWAGDLPAAALWFVPLLFFGIRPLSALLGLAGSRTSGLERGLVAWFGIRGIGSIYYVMYATEQGLTDDLARLLTGITLATVAASILVHGASVRPLMAFYHGRGRAAGLPHGRSSAPA